ARRPRSRPRTRRVSVRLVLAVAVAQLGLDFSYPRGGDALQRHRVDQRLDRTAGIRLRDEARVALAVAEPGHVYGVECGQALLVEPSARACHEGVEPVVDALERVDRPPVHGLFVEHGLLPRTGNLLGLGDITVGNPDGRLGLADQAVLEAAQLVQARVGLVHALL